MCVRGVHVCVQSVCMCVCMHCVCVHVYRNEASNTAILALFMAAVRFY